MGETFNSALKGGLAAYGAYDAYGNAAKQRDAQTVGAQSQQARLGQFLLASGLANQTASLTGDQMVAPLNADQLAGMQGIRNTQGMGQSDYAGAMDTARNAGISDADVTRFMNPYTDNVVNTTLADIDNQRRQQLAQISSQAEAAGAFGGDRAEVAKSLANQTFDQTAASTAAQLRSAGYTQAVNSATNNAGLKLSGNAQLQSLIDARRNAAQTDAGNLINAGGLQQQNDQAKLDWLKQRVGVALAPVQAFGGTQPYTGAVTSPTAAGAAGLVGGASTAGGIASLISSIFGGGSGDPSGGYGNVNSNNDALYGPGGDFGSWLDGVLGDSNSNGNSGASGGYDATPPDWWNDLYGGGSGGFNSASGEAANGTIDPVSITQSKVPVTGATTGGGLSFGNVGSSIGNAAGLYAGVNQGGTAGYGKALASGAGLASSLGYGGTATNAAGLAGNVASGNYVGAAKNALSMFGNNANAATSGASAAGSSAGAVGGLSAGQLGGLVGGAYNLTQKQGKFAGTASMALNGYQVGGPWGALVGAIIGYAKEGGVKDANPLKASGLTGITMDQAWKDQNIARLASNPAASVASKLGVKSDSVLGKVLDPGSMLSGHKGSHWRNWDAFNNDFAGTTVNADGNYVLPSQFGGAVVNQSQLDNLAGTYYGARYAPDGDQAGWTQKFQQALQEIKGK